jgi:sucrose-6-phosphate hydrolase SacC (GH32 family)
VSRAGSYRFSSKFDSSNVEQLPSMNGTIAVDLIIDRSSVEAFVNRGEAAIAETMFPTDGTYTVALHSSGARITQMDIWDLRSIWRSAKP